MSEKKSIRLSVTSVKTDMASQERKARALARRGKLIRCHYCFFVKFLVFYVYDTIIDIETVIIHNYFINLHQ